MYIPSDSELNEHADNPAEWQLILDGTAHVDELEDVSIPRVKGLVELICDYFGK